MKWCLITSYGKIINTGEAPDGTPISAVSHQDGIVMTGIPAEVTLQTHYYNNAFTRFPNCPSEFHAWDWSTHTWTQDRGLAENLARAKRADLLSASDWTQLPDVPLETKATWAANRQALRDITDQPGFPFEITWPIAPNKGVSQ